jgi:hypothetical protein
MGQALVARGATCLMRAMHLRTHLGLAALALVGASQTSSAVVRPKGADAPIVSTERGPRTYRSTAFTRVAGMTAIMDRDTDVPLRMWGSSAPITNVVSDAAIAEASARQLLAQHLATIAPGSSVADFALVANDLTNGIRTIGFAQYKGGLRVLGAGVGFTFKQDRLVMISSTAMPNIDVVAPAHRIATTSAVSKLSAWFAEENMTARLVPAFAQTRVIMPIVRPRIGARPDITYRVAEQVAMEQVDGPGRWDVWLDAADGAPIARKSTIHFSTGKVLFDAADRYPSGPRGGKPAAFATHTVDGVAVTSTADGSITWAGTAAASVALTLAGPYVSISNKAGTRLTETKSLAPGATLTWSRATEEANDAQISAFIFANQAKAFAKANVNPELAWLNDTLTVVVNENQTCNAYSTGDDIHFYKKGTQCENTGRIADVVFHEFGHSLHAHSIIDGVGAFDSALSEGMSDMYAALITRDHGMGRGFFFTSSPLRDLDNGKRWPDNTTGEPHDDGEIIGGAMWHLGQGLEAKLGATAGYQKTIEMYYGVLQRASDIPTAYAAALVVDDNDGDLTNGTPNQCVINAAFGQHGLADPSLTLGIGAPQREGNHVSIDVKPSAAAAACPGAATVAAAKIEWRPRGGQIVQVPLSLSGTTYAGDIPAQPDGTVVQYKVTLTLSDNSTVSYPKNDADPFYEMYVGPVAPIWCSDFEQGATDWTHGSSVANRDEWQDGEPMGLGGDPKTAHGGTKVFGIDLRNDGVYRSKATHFAESPEIDLAGETQVRLQYYRWLGVEDGVYDQAKIYVNGTEAWKNYRSASMNTQGVSHIDREWRFQDVDLSAAAATGKVKLKFEITADEGFELGGWTLDDVCIVAMHAPDTCTGDDCEPPSDDGGGCCSVGGGPEGALGLSLLTLGLVLRRRRTRTA